MQKQKDFVTSLSNPAISSGIRKLVSWRHRSLIVLLLSLVLVVHGSVPGAASGGPSNDSPRSKHRRQSVAPQEAEVEAAMVHHAPQINGRVEGSVRQLAGEDTSLNGNAVITSALLVPGTPQVVTHGNGKIGSTVQGTGNPLPSNYSVTLNGNATIGRLVNRVDPLPLPIVAPPPAPAGTRDVVITDPNQSVGDFSTLRDLTLNGNNNVNTGSGISVTVPPGTYRNFTANGTSSFVFGIAGSTQPSIYNLQSLILNGGAKLQVAGLVTLTIQTQLDLEGAAGASTDPLMLSVKVAAGGVTVNAGSSLFAAVLCPSGRVVINANSLLQGSVVCDQLAVNGGAMLKGTPGVFQAISPSSGFQGQSLTVTLRGDNTHWKGGLTVASLGGEISVGGAPAGSPGPIQVTDPTTATANIVISPTAALAPRTVTITTPVTSFSEGESETLINAFKVSAASPPGAASSRVSTIAGFTSTPGFADGPGPQARFHDLSAVAIGPDDTIYVADSGNNRIRAVHFQSGAWVVSTLAGDGAAGFADGPAGSAHFNNPRGIAVDAAGVVYVADTGNNRIRKVGVDGTVSTLAGDGTAGLQNGPGGQARFNAPRGVSADSHGNLYIADTGNSTVRFISNIDIVSSVAGDGTIGSNDSPNAHFDGLIGVAVDGLTAFIYLADTSNQRIRRLDPNGAVITLTGADRGFADGSTSQARFADPSGIAVDGAGKIIVADATNSLLRQVDPVLVPAASPLAATTLAGTGDRGLTDGPGNVARFFTPAGVAVSHSSALIVADTGNQVLRRVLLPPIIDFISPSQGHPGDTIKINGDRFDARSPGGNTVMFARSTLAGGGQTPAQVTAATQDQLIVTVPADAATGPVTVQTEGGSATSPSNFTVAPTGPVISDFNPKSGPIGTLVNVTGSNLAPPAGTAAQVTLNKQGGGTIAAPVSSAAAGNLSFVIPAGAATGPITVTVGGQSTTSSAPLTVVASSDFGLTAAPAAADLIQGQSISYAVALSSNSGFNQLADLNATGLPSGVTASFKPARITAGQTSVLTLKAPASQPTGSAALTVSAASNVDGIALTKSAKVTLNVRPITTSFTGRTVVANTLETPLAGVTVKFLGRDSNGAATGCSGQTVSDAAGNFAFTNLSSSCTGPQLIRYDGTTAVSPAGKYAGVDLIYNIVANQVTTSPVLVHLPRIDDKETVMVRQNATADQTFTFKTIPNLSATVYAGTTFTLADGTRPDPFPFTAIQVPVDRLADAKPPNPAMMMVFIVAFQPANSEASQPVAITYPNTINTPPGVNMVLMTLDPTKGQMVPYGTGTVSSDGTQVVPDLDPAHPGRRFGLVHFDWHAQMPPPPPQNNPQPPPCPPPCPQKTCCSGCNQPPPPTAGKPVDLSSGIETIEETDIAVTGLRGGVAMVRTYRTLSNLGGPFGVGTSHNYGYALNTNTPLTANVINLVLPDGNRLPFNKQPNGTLINTTSPSMIGAVMTVLPPEGHVTLRWKDGTTYQFLPSTTALGSVLTSIVDANGNRVSLTRNVSSPAQITEITDPVGRKLLLTYDGANRITTITDVIGRVVRYTYNGQGTLETVTDPANGVARYDYDTQNRLTRLTDARGVIVAQNTYDANGRVIQQVQADGGVWRFNYTLLNPTAPSVSPVLSTAVNDPNGNVTTYRFNPQGFLTDVTDSTGQTRIIERAPGSNQTMAFKGAAGCSSCGSAASGDQTFTYDQTGNLQSVADALGNTTRYTYESLFNKIATITDPLGNVTRFTYDSSGNIVTSTDANGHQTTFEYGAGPSFGLVKSITDPLNKSTALAYDGFANLTTITDALNNSTVISYDAVSRPVGTLDALGHSSIISYDALDRIVSTTDAKADITRFGYDQVGNLSSVTDARGSTTSFTFDPMNRLSTRTDPLGKSDIRKYDFNGNLTQFTDRRGQASNFTYDSLNRRVGESYQDSAVTRAYEANGRLVRVDDSLGGAFTFNYDLAGRLTGSTTQFGTVGYSYDADGRVTTRQVAGQPAVTYSYDPPGNMLSAAMPQAAVSLAYDARNQVQTVTRSNGVSTSYGYDSVGHVLSIAHARGAANVNTQTYSYDAVGNRISTTSGIGQPLITQPSVNQFDLANRMLQRGATTNSYDGSGNLLSEVSSAGTTTYTWDARNRLQRMTTSAGQSTSLLYDFAGNLISQKDSGPALNLVKTFVLDDLTNVAYLGSSDGQQLSLLAGQSIDDHLATIPPRGQVEYGLTDAINSTIATTDQSGEVVSRFEYEPYGQSSGAGTYPFHFTGRTIVSGALHYYRARFYNSNMTRFISEDPIGFAGGPNLYEYAGNGPINAVDPAGLQTITLGWQPGMPVPGVPVPWPGYPDPSRLKAHVGTACHFPIKPRSPCPACDDLKFKKRFSPDWFRTLIDCIFCLLSQNI